MECNDEIEIDGRLNTVIRKLPLPAVGFLFDVEAVSDVVDVVIHLNFSTISFHVAKGSCLHLG